MLTYEGLHDKWVCGASFVTCQLTARKQQLPEETLGIPEPYTQALIQR